MPIFSSGYPEKTSNSDEDRFLISDSTDSNKIKGTKWSTIRSSIEEFTDWNSLIQELNYSSDGSWSEFGSIYYREYGAKSWPAPFEELYVVYVVYSSGTARQSWLGGIVADKNGVSTIREYRPSSSIVMSTFKIIGLGEIQA